MHYYQVCLPKRNHWNDEFESWIESSYTRGSAIVEEYDEDDIHGIVGRETIDEIPIQINDGNEGFDVTIID